MGQKWGKRNGPPYPLKPGAHSQAEKQAKSSTSKKTSSKDNRTGGFVDEVAIPIAAYATALAAYAVAWRTYIKQADKKARKKGAELAKKVIDEKTGPIKNGMHTLPKPETTEEAIKNTNPMYDTQYGKVNCTSCVLAAYLRQEGYDVNAKPFGIIGANTRKEYKKIIKNYNDVATETPIVSRSHAEKEILKATNGEDGSGALNVWWSVGGGHIFNWKVENGKVQFYDVQPAGQEVDIDSYFKMINKTQDSIIYRFDTADFDWEKLREYVHG